MRATHAFVLSPFGKTSSSGLATRVPVIIERIAGRTMRAEGEFFDGSMQDYNIIGGG